VIFGSLRDQVPARAKVGNLCGRRRGGGKIDGNYIQVQRNQELGGFFGNFRWGFKSSFPEFFETIQRKLFDNNSILVLQDDHQCMGVKEEKEKGKSVNVDLDIVKIHQKEKSHHV